MRGEADQRVLHQLEHDRPDQPAVQIAGSTQDEHEQHVGRSVERQHIERRELRGLREQRAGDPGVCGRERVDRDEPRIDRNADRGGAQAVALERTQREAERRMHEPPRDEEQHEQDREAVHVGDVPGDVEGEHAEHRADDDAL